MERILRNRGRFRSMLPLHCAISYAPRSIRNRQRHNLLQYTSPT